MNNDPYNSSPGPKMLAERPPRPEISPVTGMKLGPLKIKGSGDYVKRQQMQMESAYRAAEALAGSGRSIRST